MYVYVPYWVEYWRWKVVKNLLLGFQVSLYQKQMLEGGVLFFIIFSFCFDLIRIDFNNSWGVFLNLMKEVVLVLYSGLKKDTGGPENQVNFFLPNNYVLKHTYLLNVNNFYCTYNQKLWCHIVSCQILNNICIFMQKQLRFYISKSGHLL